MTTTACRTALALTLVALMARSPALAAGADGIGLRDLFGFGTDDSAKLTINEREMASLGCLATSAVVGLATILFGGAAIIVTRGQGAAAATTVAIPVLAATMTAGCALGSQAAPGIAWLRRNGDALFGKMVNVLPVEPLSKVLP